MQRLVEVLALVPVTMAFFGTRVLADVTELRRGHAGRGGPRPMMGLLTRKGVCAHREGQAKTEAEKGVTWPQAKGCQGLLAAATGGNRGRAQSLPQKPQRGPALPAP